MGGSIGSPSVTHVSITSRRLTLPIYLICMPLLVVSLVSQHVVTNLFAYFFVDAVFMAPSSR